MRTSRQPPLIAARKAGGAASIPSTATRGASRSRHATLTAKDPASKSIAAPAPSPATSTPASAGAGDARDREAQSAQGIGGLQLAGVRHRLGQQAGERRLEEGVGRPVEGGQHAEQERARRVGHQQDAADGLHHEARDVGGDEHAAAVAAVGDDAAGQREDEEGHELRGDDEPDGLDAPAGLEHGEGQRHEHDAVADEREDLPGEQQPELRLGAQHLRDERADPPHRGRAYAPARV